METLNFTQPNESDWMAFAGMSRRALIAHNDLATVIVDFDEQTDEQFVHIYTMDNVAMFEGVEAVIVLAQINKVVGELAEYDLHTIASTYDAHQIGY